MASRLKPNDLMDSEEFTLSSATDPDLDITTPSSPEMSMKKITKHLVQRKQMSHDMQVMKIELNQRTLALENLKAEFSTKEEEMQEKIQQLQHQKTLLQTKLDTELEIQRSEARHRQDASRREFEAALTKQRQLEEANSRLIDTAADLKRQLGPDALQLTAQRYEELSARPERDVSVQDFVAMRVFEAVRPSVRELRQLRERFETTEAERRQLGEERAELAEGYSRERELHQALQEEYQKTLASLADTKALVQHGNFKIESFDGVRDARDRAESQLADLRERHRSLSTEQEALLRERDELARELSSARQAVTLLTQDKEYLTRQGADLAVRVGAGEDRVQQLTRQLDEAKEAREELYEKYVHSRDEYKTQYECRLRDELEQLRVRTDSELERLRTNSEAAFERENRSLRDQRDEAALDRERAEARLKEVTSKYEALQRDLSSLQSCADSRIGELLSDSKLKAFEAERTSLMLEETRSKLRDLELTNEKLQAKLETATKEYYELDSRSMQRLAELETRAEEQKAKLESYEAVEAELDSVVMEAAEKCDEEDINMERVTFTFAAGANLPSTARRRMQHSVQLARRVLALERRVRELTRELEESRAEREKAQEEAERAQQVLNDAQQPYGYLIDSLRSRDDEIGRLKEQRGALEAEVRGQKREKAELVKVKNAMSADLEKLLSQREELAMLKQLMVDLREQRNARKQQGAPVRRRGGDASGKTAAGSEKVPGLGLELSGRKDPEEAPAWAKKLQERQLPSPGKKAYGVYYS